MDYSALKWNKTAIQNQTDAQRELDRRDMDMLSICNCGNFAPFNNQFRNNDYKSANAHHPLCMANCENSKRSLGSSSLSGLNTQNRKVRSVSTPRLLAALYQLDMRSNQKGIELGKQLSYKSRIRLLILKLLQLRHPDDDTPIPLVQSARPNFATMQVLPLPDDQLKLRLQ